MMQLPIPVFKPLLPPAAKIAAYIVQADAARHYTNRGPLVQKLEQRLASALSHGEHCLSCTSTGTSAIEAAILAHAGPAQSGKRLAFLPSFTFAATALAVQACGYVPHFVDIDPETWALRPEEIAAHPLRAQAGLVVSVAAFGKMPDIGALEELQAASGLPVVLDAAAAFETLLDRPEVISTQLPLTLSFHATKTFSTGEGGAVVWDDAAAQARVVQVSNFGFHHSRECRVAGINAKMSEYHAAVGHAMLDSFDARRADYARIASLYADLAAKRALPGRLHLAPDVSSAYIIFEAHSTDVLDKCQAYLHAHQVETRRWYERGLHVQPYFAPLPSGQNDNDLAQTEALAGRLLGLPMAHDLSAETIEYVLDMLQAATMEQSA
ncbi:MAG: DegT/DnrJ/EryC1/StrS family aminotransferase [Rhodobacteraceae bacterium]|nr:DegT/DnrJ/EryC1/StrS family aminotransferase [Paracoccaceae bacterium]